MYVFQAFHAVCYWDDLMHFVDAWEYVMCVDCVFCHMCDIVCDYGLCACILCKSWIQDPGLPTVSIYRCAVPTCARTSHWKCTCFIESVQ